MITLDLEDFNIYRCHSTRGMHEKTMANEMVSLHNLDGGDRELWYFDGVISYGQSRKRLKQVPCHGTPSIGGFEDVNLHTVGSEIWIRSDLSRKSKINLWYCLRSPSTEYERFHKPFLWLADLAKHLVDYCHAHSQVSLVQFRQDFYAWLRLTHSNDETFQRWLKVYNDTDFRRIVSAHAVFLFNQAAQIRAEYRTQPLWDEIHPYDLRIVPKQTEQIKAVGQSSQPLKSTSHARTVVTPFVYECFKHLPWARFLVVQHPSSTLRRNYLQKKISSAVNYRPHAEMTGTSSSNDAEANLSNSDILNTQNVRIGDVVALESDPQAKTKWKSNDALWYGYVQDITEENELKLIWLYRPSDTACQGMRYPHSNELFLSDNCNCDEGSKYAHEAIYAHEVVAKPRVAFFGNPSTPNADCFVRQRYIGADSAWVSLKLSDFRCGCKDAKQIQQYLPGTTLLVKLKFIKALQVVELVEYSIDGREIRVRRLPRRSEHDDDAADPNELVYTAELVDIPSSAISRSCHVRFYSKMEKEAGDIPVPYCRNGTVDFFYITSEEQEHSNGRLIPLERPWPATLVQGYDPLTPSQMPTMRGLDIFCGGGSLGRGLEDGGAVKMEWAVDYFREAIHTYRANTHDPEKTKLFYGSVNEFLSQAMKGQKDNLVAQFGEVDVLSAGHPCQGFSQVNQKKMTDQSLINNSMVASVVSFVDFYRPKYALLENVLGMVKCGSSSETEEPNVFAQILCALVGLGYQVRPYLLDAWNFGSPQSRSRVFISITAPGLTPLPNPPHSHSHPSDIKARGLGKGANGLPFAERYDEATPFTYTTIGEATKDLPRNQDGKVDCIPFPDHRNTRATSSINQVRISQIPKHPGGMSFVRAVNLGWMPETQINAYSWDQPFKSRINSRAWKRVLSDGLMPTVTTICCPEDGISGQWLHWDCDRPITIMEARRAQGFPDHEIIVGTPLRQWKIIGNSVARPVAMALGVSLRTAWLANREIEAKAQAEQFARSMETARKMARMPHQQEESEAVFSQNSVSLRKIMTGVLIERRPLRATMEDPIVVSSDSDSDEPAIFTSGPSNITTRETTTSDTATTPDDDFIVEV